MPEFQREWRSLAFRNLGRRGIIRSAGVYRMTQLEAGAATSSKTGAGADHRLSIGLGSSKSPDELSARRTIAIERLD